MYKHKNLPEIQLFHIRPELLPNVVLNRIRYLDIQPLSKLAYPIPFWVQATTRRGLAF